LIPELVSIGGGAPRQERHEAAEVALAHARIDDEEREGCSDDECVAVVEGDPEPVEPSLG